MDAFTDFGTPSTYPGHAGQGGSQGSVALEMHHISKKYPGIDALKGVSISVQAGEVRALLGENGAGKSTLMNVLSGSVSDYGGEIVIDGKSHTIRTPRDAQRLGIAMIHQELNLVPELSVSDNIFLGREMRNRWGVIDRPAMHREAARLMAELDLVVPPTRLIRLTRIAEQQLIEVSKALALDARILIMDEPTSALAEAEVQRLFTVIRQVSSRGVAVIYISHRLEELSQIADTVTVLRDGELIGTRPMADVSRTELIRMMVGRPLSDLFPKTESRSGSNLLRVENLGLQGDPAVARRALHDITFSLQAGEILGLAGLMGAGRTEVLETIFGVHAARVVRGQVFVQDRLFTRRSPRRAIRRGMAFITEDRKGQSLINILSVRFNISLSALNRFVRLLFIDRNREGTAVTRSIRELQIKTSSPAALVDNLSGGNQQKVVLAKCLLVQPRVLLMDEPTRGIDVGAKAEIYELMNRLSGEGIGILMVSSELPELLAMCDRILVLCEGRVTAEFARGEATQEAILDAATSRAAVLAHVG